MQSSSRARLIPHFISPIPNHTHLNWHQAQFLTPNQPTLTLGLYPKKKLYGYRASKI